MKTQLIITSILLLAISQVVQSGTQTLDETNLDFAFDNNIEVYYTNLMFDVQSSDPFGFAYIPSYNFLLNNSLSQGLEVDFKIVHDGTTLYYYLEYASTSSDVIVLMFDIDEDGSWDMSEPDNGEYFDYQIINTASFQDVHDGHAIGSSAPVYNDENAGGVNNALGHARTTSPGKFILEGSMPLDSDDNPYDINLAENDATLFRLAVYVDGTDPEDIYTMNPTMLSIETTLVSTIDTTLASTIDALEDPTTVTTSGETTTIETITETISENYTVTTTELLTETIVETTRQEVYQTITEYSNLTVTDIITPSFPTSLVTSIVFETSLLALTSAKSELNFYWSVFLLGIGLQAIIRRSRKRR
ncbi:MAG: hypothetical protein INQ03_04925 [Candidatus Heimdallarchaeota archaeon]|nr:hypothetical protein [Candidatus Heimdallarchaeota archaeon]